MTIRTIEAPPSLRRKIWAVVFALPALALLCGLGVWQLQRLQWKEALIDQYRACLTMPPSPFEFDGLDAKTALTGKACRKVQVTGRYESARQFAIGPRTFKGRAGVHVVTIFRLADGHHVLVNRGFWQQKMAALPALSEGKRQLVGLLRDYSQRPPYAVDNVPQKRQWYWYDMAAIGRVYGVILPPIVLDLLPVAAHADTQGRPSFGPGPRPVSADHAWRNNHLSYAVTWFAFAVILLVILIMFCAKGRPKPAPGS